MSPESRTAIDTALYSLPEGTVWHSTSTGGGDCVEVAVMKPTAEITKKDAPRLYVLRDSKDPDGPKLYYTPSEWAAFVVGVKDGEFDDIAENVFVG